jgi:DNA polymerase III alpha subunit (gram-positive type)
MIFDAEGDSLYPSKFHVISYNDNGEIKSLTSYDEMREWLLKQPLLIGHNILLWDIPHLERVLEIKITARIIDTLALSWYIFPKRKIYGLEAFGEYYNIPKPPITDWENLSLEEYVHRCETDVRINTELWKDIINRFSVLYDIEEEKVINGLCIRARE